MNEVEILSTTLHKRLWVRATRGAGTNNGADCLLDSLNFTWPTLVRGPHFDPRSAESRELLPVATDRLEDC
jgi:hypothetical protein